MTISEQIYHLLSTDYADGIRKNVGYAPTNYVDGMGGDGVVLDFRSSSISALSGIRLDSSVDVVGGVSVKEEATLTTSSSFKGATLSSFGPKKKLAFAHARDTRVKSTALFNSELRLPDLYRSSFLSSVVKMRDALDAATTDGKFQDVSLTEEESWSFQRKQVLVSDEAFESVVSAMPISVELAETYYDDGSGDAYMQPFNPWLFVVSANGDVSWPVTIPPGSQEGGGLVNVGVGPFVEGDETKTYIFGFPQDDYWTAKPKNEAFYPFLSSFIDGHIRSVSRPILIDRNSIRIEKLTVEYSTQETFCIVMFDIAEALEEDALTKAFRRGAEEWKPELYCALVPEYGLADYWYYSESMKEPKFRSAAFIFPEGSGDVSLKLNSMTPYDDTSAWQWNVGFKFNVGGDGNGGGTLYDVDIGVVEQQTLASYYKNYFSLTVPDKVGEGDKALLKKDVDSFEDEISAYSIALSVTSEILDSVEVSRSSYADFTDMINAVLYR